MKYKFLLRLYKNSNNIRMKSENDISEAKNYLYTNILPVIYEFKENNKDVDCSFLDALLDKCLLAGELMTWDMNKEYRILKKFISKLNVIEFKIIHKLRLILEAKLIKEEVNLVCSRNKITLFGCFILILAICEGGVLYLPVKYKDKTINIGRQLDALADLKELNNENPIVRYTIESNTTKKAARDFVRNINEKIAGCNNKYEGLIYSKYYIELLNLAFALTNPNVRSKVENYLTEDSFKYSPQYLALVIKENKNLRERYVAESNVAEELYNRKVLLPEDGVVIKNKEEQCSTIVCECDDDIFGRIIFWHTWQDEIGIHQSECVLLTDKVTTIGSMMPGTEDVFNIYGVADKFKDSNIDLISLAPLIDEESGEANIEVTKAHVKVEEKQDMYAPVYWQYRNINSVQTSDSEDKLYGQEIKLLAPFKRTLPMGQKRSEEASALAKKLCINLKDNETVVSGFERKQKVRIK